jgi:hypothetical protein
MNNYFKKRIDDTRQAYLDALERLKKGIPNHPDLKGKEYKINATTIALESGKSRNPLYHTHKDILDMINEVVNEDKKEEKKVRESSEVEILKQKIKDLEEQNKKLINVNATLLFKININ